MKRILFQTAVTIGFTSTGVSSNNVVFTTILSQYGCTIKKISCGFVVSNLVSPVTSFKYRTGCMISGGGAMINDSPVRGSTGLELNAIYISDGFEHTMEHKIPSGTELEFELALTSEAITTGASNVTGTIFLWIEFEEEIQKVPFGGM